MPEGRKTRVAIVAQFPPPPAGMSLQAEYLAQRLEADGAEVVRVDTMPWGRRRPRSLRFLRFIKSLGLLKGNDVALVITGAYAGFFTFNLFTFIAAQLYGVPTVALMKSGLFEGFAEKFSSVVRLFMKLPAGVWVTGEYLKSVLAKVGLESEVVPDLIDPGPLPKREYEPESPPVFLLPRHLFAIYRVDHAIRAFAEIQKIYPEAELHIAGDGEERKRLEDLAAKITDGNVFFHGWISRKPLNELYKKATLLLNTNLVDNYPNAILEAMIIGVPVVSYNVGGVPYLIEDKVNGFLVPSGDLERLADTITYCVENPDVCKSIVASARKKVEELYWPVGRPGLLDLLSPYMRSI
ncbi:MAG: glycosyltransferase family 4 protein [Candidatus Coatesbacteria bacterium]|nr:MAG: glycosyltransferase family 4 protein [Candidatus Coatesbacteria bacterium]